MQISSRQDALRPGNRADLQGVTRRGLPAIYSGQSREMKQIDKRAEVVAYQDTCDAKLREMRARFRKMYAEGRFRDFSEVTDLVAMLAGADDMKFTMLLEAASQYIQGELMIMMGYSRYELERDR